MKISIITATFNSSATLRDTIESVLSQSFKDYQHLIIDGGSTDDTKAIVEEYIPKSGGRLVWYSGKDKGLYDAMNKGIERATGDIVGILNSDDFYADNQVLERIASGCEDVEAVYGDLIFVDPVETDHVVREWKGSQHYKGAFMLSLIQI